MRTETGDGADWDDQAHDRDVAFGRVCLTMLTESTSISMQKSSRDPQPCGSTVLREVERFAASVWSFSSCHVLAKRWVYTVSHPREIQLMSLPSGKCRFEKSLDHSARCDADQFYGMCTTSFRENLCYIL